MSMILYYISRDIHDDDLENDIREAFRCFDKGKTLKLNKLIH